MLSDLLLWFYLEIEYCLKKNWRNTKLKRERKLIFEERLHFLKRQYKIERTDSYGWSVLVGWILSLSFCFAYDLEGWLVLVGAFLIFWGLHHSIITFFWKVKLIKQIRFKAEFFPIDQKFKYRIKTTNRAERLFNLYYESYLGMTDSFGYIEYTRRRGEEELKRQCFYLIEDVKKSINATDKKYDDLPIGQKELIKVEWSITGGYTGKLSFANDFWHTQYSRWYLFYAIEEKKIGCNVKCVVLSKTECYLLELA